MVTLFIKMGIATLGNFRMIKGMAMETINIPMDDSTLVGGAKESNMVLASIPTRKRLPRMDFGKMANAFTGLIMNF